MTKPLEPSVNTLVKLGSIMVHADEMMSADGHAFDRIALQHLLRDPEVLEWRKEMDAMAMLPKMRREKPTP